MIEFEMKAKGRNFFETDDIKIIKDNVLTTDEVKNREIDLIVTSPPYNVDIKYNSHDDQISYEKYLEFSTKWLTRCFHWLKNDGRLCLNIPLDKYLPGFCIWKALDISYKIILANGRTIYDTSTGVSFTLVHPSNIKKVTQVWRCNDSNCSLITDSLHHLFNRPLHRQQSYEYELIIKK